MKNTIIFKPHANGSKIADYRFGSIIKFNGKFQVTYFGKSSMVVEHATSLSEAKKRLDIISDKKVKQQGLKSPAFKGFKKKPKKSAACSKVLQLMDRDYSYQAALKEVLNSDKRLNKKKLEAELDFYV